MLFAHCFIFMLIDFYFKILVLLLIFYKSLIISIFAAQNNY